MSKKKSVIYPLAEEWTAPLDKGANRPGPIGTFAFTKMDQERAVLFGGHGSNGRVNEVYIFHFDNRVRCSAGAIIIIH